MISNNAISAKIPVRKSQYIINTWHGGGAFKKVGIDIDNKVNGVDREMLKISAKQTSIFLASSEEFYNGTGKGNCIPQEKVCYVGMPRNDILFADNTIKNDINKRVRQYFNISTEKILLYAPTFRGEIGSTDNIKGEEFDWDIIKKALSERFPGEWRLMFRGHYHSKNSIIGVDGMIDASSYPDMQELLITSDALITDYSSVIWDYSLMDKPAFLYCPDLDNYKNERDFYTPIENWPYLYATNNSDISKIILNYSHNKTNIRRKKYHEQMHGFENGRATDEIVDVIINIINAK